MSDLIDRQEAIEIVDFECGEWRGLAETIEKRLSGLSSVQLSFSQGQENDLISRQAAIDAVNNLTYPSSLMDVKRILVDLPSAQPASQWNPVKTRPMTEEERQEYSERFGYDIEYEDAVMFECKMPDDGQEILVSYRHWISMDKCEIDDGCYGLEGNGDWEDVIAWMPLPEPYREEGDK